LNWALLNRIGLFRRSIRARAVALTVLFSSVALLVLGGFLSYTIDNGLYSARLEQTLVESRRAAIEVQNTFTASTVSDEVALQSLVNQVVPNYESSGDTQSRRVALLRSPNQELSQVLQSPISADLDTSVITPELRKQVVEAEGKLAYQSVALQVNSESHPGIVVGAPITIPLAGEYELYFVYDIQNEQQSLDFVQRSLLLGGLALILLISGVAYFVTGWLVKPVQDAAAVAERITEGALDERLDERGEDVIAALGRSFNRMTETLQQQITKLRQLSTMQQRFVSDVSHELRTPLTAMMLTTGTMRDRSAELPADIQRDAELLHSATERFNALVSNLLEISRYDAGAIQANFEVQDFGDTVQLAVEDIQAVADRYKCRIDLNLPDAEIDAEFDSRRIERILRNLLSNAIEHGEGKPITIDVAASKNAVAVSVTDQGIGMNREQVDRVFDRFWRADKSRVRTLGGTGLGLAISLEDAHLHNGWLQVWAAPNRGSSFRLTIPRRQGQVFNSSPLPLPPKKTIRNPARGKA
jgi:two-component system sensor histidine kinase MtrB